MINTTDLKPGDVVRLLHYGAIDADYRRRLIALGMTCGVEVRVLRRAPLGCPLEIEVRGLLLVIREHEASSLVWEYV
jgi:ferrous iron transport protein A